MRNGLIIDKNGDRRWYKNDVLHREDGPALEFTSGTKSWIINGKSHRLDGPAIEWQDGHKLWFINGKNIKCNTNEEFLRLVKLKEFW